MQFIFKLTQIDAHIVAQHADGLAFDGYVVPLGILLNPARQRPRVRRPQFDQRGVFGLHQFTEAPNLTFGRVGAGRSRKAFPQLTPLVDAVNKDNVSGFRRMGQPVQQLHGFGMSGAVRAFAGRHPLIQVI